MGSSGEDPSKGIDARVGGLVWVCRRNGSWWPGRILGPADLPEGSFPASRLGVPVKLLGRDDASVDWYNLEKSKRVKAFRCEQFDDFIEKAKESSFTSHLYKRPVKYARREDAILEALQLENASLGVEPLDFSVRPGTQHAEDHNIDYGESFSEKNGDDDKNLSGSKDDSELVPQLSQSGVSIEEQDHIDAVKKEFKEPDDSEDDGSERVKRMRGIEDLGMGVASKMKRKGAKGVKGHEILKRKNRSRPLTKVLECTAMVPPPVVCKEASSPTGSNVLGALGSFNSKKKNSVVINTSDSTGVSCENTTSVAASMHAGDASLGSRQKELELGSPDNESRHSLFNVPITSQKKNSAGFSKAICGASKMSKPGTAAQSSQSSHMETTSLGNEEPNDSNSTSSGTANIHNITQTIKKGTSDWQLKGKRNSRSRKIDLGNETSTHAAKSRPISEIQLDEIRGWCTNTHCRKSSTHIKWELPAPPRLLPHRHSRFSVNPKYESSDFSLRHHVNNSGLFEVKIEAQTSCKPQQVPYISLMSKLNGRPIIGHPVEIEVLDDGFCDRILNFPEYFSSSSEFDHSVGVDKVYGRMAREKPSVKRGPRGPYKPRNLWNSPKPRKNGKSGLWSKKMRKLSSLIGLNMRSKDGEEKKLIVEKVKHPVIACVPLSVVFSRIHADLSNSMRTPAPRLASAGCV